MRVWREVDSHRDVCNFGRVHNVGTWAGKDIEPTGDTYEFNTGYGIQHEKVFTDRQGRLYYAHSPIDYYGGMYYTTTIGKVVYSFRSTAKGYDYNVDTLGRNIDPPRKAI